MRQRLQKIISAAGLASRRAAEKMINDGRVKVNGKTALLGESADPEFDTICVDGSILREVCKKTYIMLNKPRGYVTSLKDEKGRRTVSELVKDAGVRLYPVGRLDMYSEGLLLMTNDGDFANRLMHPSHEVKKTYIVNVFGGDVESAVPILSSALTIDGYTIKPALVNVLSNNGDSGEIEITIHEGRNRQVRKMCESAGLKVSRLVRVSEGEVQLGKLRSGKWRYLTQQELDLLMK